MSFGFIIDPESAKDIDQVLVTVFRAPRSFTGEDMIEISSHGGIALPNKILDLLLRQGVRLAEKGEFSKRAFFNGKIDLTQAEAINDIISSSTLAGSELALNNLKRNLSDPLSVLRNEILYLCAKLEVLIDNPEEELEDWDKEDTKKLRSILESLQSLIKTGERSRKIAQGFRVVLAGKTNVGKSSLLNALAGEERAIVSQIHGTTRDVIEVELNLDGLPVVLIDTAGIRETYENEIEGYGIIKTQENLKRADLILFILDGETGLTGEDERALEYIHNEKTLFCLNKIDLGANHELAARELGQEVLGLSAKSGTGLPALIEKLKEVLEIKSVEETSFYVNQRQHAVLSQMAKSIEKTLEIAEDGALIDIMAFELRLALDKLSELLGFEAQPAILDTIFAHFCIGK
ncbi:MAG: tRNA uridine-5-carboxymethylaminomethyl(34) synthesis GTPase MnmE [Spirochaetae bacterium HGW-Spirochaetae-6]|nr:MAG: tRNA uridine-5-carboxymethylaminomethyl(34) synthesis GTPase MnmE [Spirochaetae bacterium HGW-Spirochaetae-6]